MKTNISVYDFMDAFNRSDTYKANFTYDGLKALYEYLIEYEEITGEEIDFDIVAICCEYSQYDDLAELQASYPNIKTMEELEDSTQVIPIPDQEGFIIQDY